VKLRSGSFTIASNRFIGSLGTSSFVICWAGGRYWCRFSGRIIHVVTVVFIHFLKQGNNEKKYQYGNYFKYRLHTNKFTTAYFFEFKQVKNNNHPTDKRLKFF
jgi:hypothetical protein